MNDRNPKAISVKNLHLIVSAFLILIIGLVYGVNPGNILPGLFSFPVNDTNLKNVFRALMGLYIAMSSIWLIAIFNKKSWVIATITNITFMSGLAIGRTTSMILDGIPGIYFVFGLIAEIILAVWGIFNLLHYTQKAA